MIPFWKTSKDIACKILFGNDYKIRKFDHTKWNEFKALVGFGIAGFLCTIANATLPITIPLWLLKEMVHHAIDPERTYFYDLFMG